MERFIQGMLSIDRRWIYLVLGLVLIVSLLLGKAVEPTVLPPAQQLFDAVNAAPAGPGDGKIIVVGMTFSAGTMGENGNQARAILRHLMIQKKRFAIISIAEPQGAEYSKAIVSDIAKQYGYRYGEDWISFGYQLSSIAFYKAFIRDIPNVIPTDGVNNEKITSYPIMQGIKSVKDVAMLIDITASASVYNWLQYVQPATQPRLPIGYACTGIMATEALPYLESGQLAGMLPGLKGAADYESLVDKLEAREIKAGHLQHAYNPDAPTSLRLPAPAVKLMFTQGTAHIAIILFILIGNIGLLLTRYRARSAGKGTK